MRKLWGTGLLSFVLAACGGGGGGGVFGGGGQDLTVAYSFSNFSQPLFAPVSASATIDGLNGNTPHCSLASGTLPPGLSFAGGGCTLTGVPTAVGTYSSTISLTVDGYKGTLTAPLQVGIAAPTLVPLNVSATGDSPPVGVGIALDHLPIVQVGTTDTAGHPTYVVQAGDTVQYQVVSGQPPQGVSVDAATGTLVGTPTVLGQSSMGVALTVTHAGTSFTTAPATIRIAAVELPWTVTYPSCCTVTEGDDISLAPTSTFHPVPGVTSAFTWYGTTPADVQLDSATGLISGWVGTRGQLFTSVTQTVTFADGSQQSVVASGIAWNVTGPYFDYVSTPLYTSPGVSFSFLPRLSDVGAPGTYSFSLSAAPGSTLPAWLNIDPSTGELSGVGVTPAQFGASVEVIVVMTTTRNGHTFTTTTHVEIAE